MITDGSGAVVGTQDHLPFGEDAGVVGENEKHRFTNYERDSESGTDYAVNRQYSTNTGRFLRPDPVAGSIADPQSLNRYAYAGNDPVNLSDPLGLNPLISIGRQLAVIFWGWVRVSAGGWGDTWIIPISASLFSLKPFGGLGQNLPTSGLSPDKVKGLITITPLHCQPDIIEAMKRAWAQSSNGTSGVEAGFRLDGAPNNYSIVENKFTNQQKRQTMTISRGVTFAIFHVHPNSGTSDPSTPKNKYSDGPSDTEIADSYKLDIYVMHRDGLTKYDHKTKQFIPLRDNLNWAKPC
jgi:RHS repeat-associated protein